MNWQRTPKPVRTATLAAQESEVFAGTAFLERHSDDWWRVDDTPEFCGCIVVTRHTPTRSQAATFADWVSDGYSYPLDIEPQVTHFYEGVICLGFYDGSWWLRRATGNSNPADPSGLECHSICVCDHGDEETQRDRAMQAATAFALATADTPWNIRKIASIFGVDPYGKYGLQMAIKAHFWHLYDEAVRQACPGIHEENIYSVLHLFTDAV